MINLTQYAIQIETGLNEALNEEYIKFRVFSDLGSYKKATRQFNTVTTYINCLLTRAPGTIETGNNGLIIASDSLRLQVAVSTESPKTTTAEPPESVENGIYKFVEQIRNVMDNYFAENRVGSITDANGKTYETGIVYSMSETGDVNMLPMIGEFITFSVGITVYIVQNGINSRNVKIEIDGEPVPFLTASPSRAGVKSADVYSDNGKSTTENIVTSTAFVLDISTPATTGRITSQFSKYLFDSTPNTLHYLKTTMGDEVNYYAVTFGDISASIEGSKNVGTPLQFIQVRDDQSLLCYPGYFTAARLVMDEPTTVSISASADCILQFVAIREVKAGQQVTLTLTSDMLQYDENTGKYFLPVRACPYANTRITLTASGATLVYDQGGANA